MTPQHASVWNDGVTGSAARNIDEPLAEQTGTLRGGFRIVADFLLVFPVHLHIHFHRALRVGVRRNFDRLHVSDGNPGKLYLGAVMQTSGFGEISLQNVSPGQETDSATDEEDPDHQHHKTGGNHEADTQLCPLQLFTLSHRLSSLHGYECIGLTVGKAGSHDRNFLR